MKKAVAKGLNLPTDLMLKLLTIAHPGPAEFLAYNGNCRFKRKTPFRLVAEIPGSGTGRKFSSWRRLQRSTAAG